ncbi:unnamed protein product [Cuscuta epithymum]|uniref:TCP domain-containing protein n=1 Tax=Cuscuta epithymum TaxID=186058 RepID=A0AAV0GI58_9ASTE|nr:unnamed protein product [Cuscuta epithymum]
MGENRQQSSSRLGIRSAGGEIVEVQGGHIVRSTGRKDRHSKVCTAKGPRDRRVRLAAHTAIQFYDVQDRLGYDRPSKAVDWLIKKAKPAIDELAELPAWKPNVHHNHRSFEPGDSANMLDGEDSNIGTGPSSNKRTAMMMMMMPPETEKDNHFLPPSLDSDAIADTIKSFFPMVAASEPHNSSASMQFQSFPQPPQPPPHQSSDLRLSLQSIQQDPTTILLHHQNHQSQHHHQTPPPARAFFAGLDSSGGWSDHQQQQQRFPVWNSAGEAAPCPTGGGFLFNTPPPLFQQLLLGGQSHYFSSTSSSSQRGPLQSSYSPSVRAWMDPSSAGFDPNQHYHHQSPLLPIYHHPPSSLSGLGCSAGDGDFSGFRIPARIQGEEEEEEHDGISDRPSSASSDSRR